MIVSWIGRLSTIALSLLLVSPCWAKPEVTINSDNTKRDTIKLRLSATDDGEPLPNLTEEDFEVISDGVSIPVKSVIPPQKNRTAPARLVILLDMSNSMLSLDSSGQTRQQGAIQAIQTILTQFKNAPLQVNIIPFGEGGGTCKSYSVSSYFKEDNFFPPNSDSLQQQLNQLAQAKLCASTNLYDPLEKTINYLKQEEARINQKTQDEKTVPTRFGIILLSDGFHSNPPRKCNQDYEPKRFEQLAKTINEAVPKITIHTLGYGFTLEELGEKWGLSRPATIEDVICPYGNESRAKDFVDQKRLAEIAKLGRGISGFSADGAEVAQQLEESVRAILGEYELVFVQPDGEPGKLYNVKVRLNFKSDSVESSAYSVRLDPWDKPLPPPILFGGIVFAIVGSIGGGIKYRDWSNKLKEEI